jgi:hypothetical protein
MSGDDRTDALISEWLSDGPTEASERLIEAILGGVGVTTGRRARGSRRTLGFDRTSFVGGAFAMGLIVAVATVAGLMRWAPAEPAHTGPIEFASGAIAASPQPAASAAIIDVTGTGGPWVHFVSRQPAFSAAYPATWHATTDYFRDGRPPIVAFSAVGRDAVIFVSIGSAVAGATMPCGPIGGPPDVSRCTAVGGRSLDELELAYGRFIERCCGAKPDVSTQHLLVDGTRAALMQTWNDPLVQGSVRDYTLAAVLVRSGTPIAIVWSSTLRDHEADRAAFVRFLGTVRFGR